MGAPNPKKYWKTYNFVNNHFFVLTTVRRRSWDQLRPKRAPKGPKMIAKRAPRSSPKRPKIDIKIDIDFGHATRVVHPEVGIVVWAAPPPGRRPGGTGEGAQAAQDRPPGTHACGKRHKRH